MESSQIRWAVSDGEGNAMARRRGYRAAVKLFLQLSQESKKMISTVQTDSGMVGYRKTESGEVHTWNFG